MTTKPTVFVSSTCYDLAQVRTDLNNFIEGHGFTPMLSEMSSFPIDPDANTVDNCKRAVREHADVLVLVVGGRYGFVDPAAGKSITNLEYIEARAKGIPIYVFVQSNVLSYLDVWKQNPSADFKKFVDSVEVFKFIESIRSASAKWTFKFETAQDITRALNSQWATLFRDLLALRARIVERPVPPGLDDVTGEALRLIIERPQLWEHRLLAAVLADCLREETGHKWEVEHRITPGTPVLVDLTGFTQLAQAQFAAIRKEAKRITRIFESAIPDALGPVGVPGDPLKLVTAARQIGSFYRFALDWGAQWQHVTIDVVDEIADEFQPILDLLGRVTTSIVKNVEEWSARMRTKIGEVLASPPGTDHGVIDMTLKLDLGGVEDELDVEMNRVTKAVTALIASRASE